MNLGVRRHGNILRSTAVIVAELLFFANYYLAMF